MVSLYSTGSRTRPWLYSGIPTGLTGLALLRVKLVWIPLIAVACAVYFFSSNKAWLMAIAIMAFAPLVPHCVCYNLGNAWWIDRIGASPLCYGWGLIVSGIAVGALSKGAHLWLSLVVCLTIIAGATGFFVSHHYFQFPW